MNWEIIGVVSEAIGASAVVVSLIYLAIQVRDNSNQNAVNRGSAINDEFNRMQETLISSPDVVDLYTKMRKREQLNDRDTALLESVANRYLTHWNSVQAAFDRGTIDQMLYDTYCEDVRRYAYDYPKLNDMFYEITEKYTVGRTMPIYGPIFQAKKESAVNETAD